MMIHHTTPHRTSSHNTKIIPILILQTICLDVLAHHGNHEVEQTHGFDEGETQNGVGEELATQSRVAGNAHEQSGEDETDTDTGTTETGGGCTHTHVLRDLDHGVGDVGGVLTAVLDVGEGLTHVGVDHGGTLGGLESSGQRGSLALVGEGTLGDGVHLEASSRASDLGGLGHGRGQTGGEDTSGSHCDCGRWNERNWKRDLRMERRAWVEGWERKRREGEKREEREKGRTGGRTIFPVFPGQKADGINTRRQNFHGSNLACSELAWFGQLDWDRESTMKSKLRILRKLSELLTS